MFKKEERKISTLVLAGVSLLLISTALFIAGKILFSEARPPVFGDGKNQSYFFDKQGEKRFLASSTYQSAQRSDSISVLVKANEGYTSSSNVSQKKEAALSFSSSLKNSYPENLLSDFERQAQQQLGKADKTDLPPAAGIGTKRSYGQKQAEEIKKNQTYSRGQAATTRLSGSSMSSKKSSFTSKPSAINSFNSISLSKGFALSSGESTFESYHSQAGRATDSSGNYGGYSALSNSNSGKSSSMQSGESSMGGASSSGGLNLNYSDKQKPDVPGPQMLVHKQVYDFGTVNIFEHARRLVTVMNIGKRNLTIGNIKRLNEEDSSFSLDNNKCSGKILAPKAECTFEIVFNPHSYGEKGDGFEIESNDADKIPYSNYVEVTGRVGRYWYSYPWLNRYKATTKMDFGPVTAGHSLELNYLLNNNSSNAWHSIKFQVNGNHFFSVSYHNYHTLTPYRPYCVVRIKFAPQDAFLKTPSSNYGKYNAVNGFNARKEILEKPVFPPHVIESPYEIEPRGGNTSEGDRKKRHYEDIVRHIPLRASTSARYPDPKIRRVDRCYSFQMEVSYGNRPGFSEACSGKGEKRAFETESYT